MLNLSFAADSDLTTWLLRFLGAAAHGNRAQSSWHVILPLAVRLYYTKVQHHAIKASQQQGPRVVYVRACEIHSTKKPKVVVSPIRIQPSEALNNARKAWHALLFHVGWWGRKPSLDPAASKFSLTQSPQLLPLSPASRCLAFKPTTQESWTIPRHCWVTQLVRP